MTAADSGHLSTVQLLMREKLDVGVAELQRRLRELGQLIDLK